MAVDEALAELSVERRNGRLQVFEEKRPEERRHGDVVEVRVADVGEAGRHRAVRAGLEPRQRRHVDPRDTELAGGMSGLNELHQVVAEATGGPGDRHRLDPRGARRVGSEDAVPVELVEALSAVGERLEVEAVGAREVS